MDSRWNRALRMLVCLALACTAAPSPQRTVAEAPPAAGPPAQSELAASPAAPASGRLATVPLDPPQTVRLVSVGLIAQTSSYLALERGYFRELGLEVQLVPLTGTSDVIALLGTDQLDVGIGQISPGFFNAVARGIGIRMVADHGTSYPGPGAAHIAVRADLLEARPWAGFQDLRGLRIALQEVNAQAEYFLERALALGGLQRSDVEIIAPMSYPDMAVAFANKAIDAAVYQEPWGTISERQGVIKKVAYLGDIEPGGHIAGLLFSEAFARNTHAARNYLVAYLRGVRDWWDAADGRADYQPVIAVQQKYTTLKDEELLRLIPPGRQNPAGYLDPAKLAAYQDWLAERGLIPQKVAIERAYDPSFAEYANAVLGPYQPAGDIRP